MAGARGNEKLMERIKVFGFLGISQGNCALARQLLQRRRHASCNFRPEWWPQQEKAWWPQREKAGCIYSSSSTVPKRVNAAATMDLVVAEELAGAGWGAGTGAARRAKGRGMPGLPDCKESWGWHPS